MKRRSFLGGLGALFGAGAAKVTAAELPPPAIVPPPDLVSGFSLSEVAPRSLTGMACSSGFCGPFVFAVPYNGERLNIIEVPR